MMKDPSYCYKFYWLEAIVHLISEGVNETTFDDVINEMICNAWYSVREFHIHLSGIQADGQVRDGLERAVLTLSDLSDLPSNASRIEIKNAIHEYDTELRSAKEARIRAMYDDKGNAIKKAGPSIPVEILGLPEVPDAGELLYAVTDDKMARQLVGKRKIKQREEQLRRSSKMRSIRCATRATPHGLTPT